MKCIKLNHRRTTHLSHSFCNFWWAYHVFIDTSTICFSTMLLNHEPFLNYVFQPFFQSNQSNDENYSPLNSLPILSSAEKLFLSQLLTSPSKDVSVWKVQDSTCKWWQKIQELSKHLENFFSLLIQLLKKTPRQILIMDVTGVQVYNELAINLGWRALGSFWISTLPLW
jgi:hypothetical protein